MEETVDFRKYPNLVLLLWDTQEKEMGAFDAFSLLDCRFSKYIRNDWLNDDERELLQRLAAKFGGGVPISRQEWSNSASPKEIIEIITEHIDRGFLETGRFRLSGGALSSIRHGGYRRAADIAFLSHEIGPFNSTKSRVHASTDLKMKREPYIDKDTVMVWAVYGDTTVRVDLICEQRFAFGMPGEFYGVNALNDTDLMTCKLLSYSDRNLGTKDTEAAQDIADILAIYKDCPDTLAPACATVLEAYGGWFAAAMKRLASADSEATAKDTLISGGVLDSSLEELMQIAPSFREAIRSFISTVPDN